MPARSRLAATAGAALVAALLAGTALAQTPDASTLESSQNLANAHPGPRSLPARAIPVPQDVSPAAQALVAAPYRVPAWDANPGSADGWRTLVKQLADAALPGIAKARADLGVTMQPTTLGGVPGFILTPNSDPGGASQSAHLQPARRRLRLRTRRVRHGRGGADGRARRLQGVRGGLPHAAGRALPGGDGRRDGGLPRRARHADARSVSRSSAPRPAAA